MPSSARKQRRARRRQALQPEQRRLTSATIPQSTIYQLPYDVWSVVASFATRSDLAHLCTTASALLAVIRPFIYRVLVLRPLVCSPTWALLARDEELASSVTELILNTCHHEVYLGRPTAPKLFVSMDALANLTSLKRVTFIGIPFQTEAEQLAFGRIFSSKSTATTKKIVFTPFKACYFEAKWPSANFGGLAGLRSIEWFPQIREQLRPLRALCLHSLQTCHTLRLPSFVFEDQTFHGIRFYHLVSLTVFDVTMHNATLPQAKRLFAAFLLSHETIEELSIANIVEPDLDSFIEDTLPRLRSFTGSALIFGGMATIGMKSLSKSLRHLVIRPSSSPVNLMWRLIRSADEDAHNEHPSSLPTLQDIQLYNTVWHTANETAILISESARCFGHSLETWRGTLAVDGRFGTMEVLISAEELGNLFAAFTRLRTIHLEIRDIDDDEGPLPLQDMSTVFSSHVRANNLQLVDLLVSLASKSAKTRKSLTALAGPYTPVESRDILYEEKDRRFQILCCLQNLYGVAIGSHAFYVSYVARRQSETLPFAVASFSSVLQHDAPPFSLCFDCSIWNLSLGARVCSLTCAPLSRDKGA